MSITDSNSVAIDDDSIHANANAKMHVQISEVTDMANSFFGPQS